MTPIVLPKCLSMTTYWSCGRVLVGREGTIDLLLGLRRPVVYGRLASTCEGGGKRRVFAVGNYVKQRLLRPIIIGR